MRVSQAPEVTKKPNAVAQHLSVDTAFSQIELREVDPMKKRVNNRRHLWHLDDTRNGEQGAA
jgi:hypothetical protein